MRLFLRRHERRAHRPRLRLAAGTEATAHFHGAGESAVIRIVKGGVDGLRAVRWTEPQIARDRWRVDDLARIENAVGIERALDLAERLVERLAEHARHEWAAHESVAVFTGQR